MQHLEVRGAVRQLLSSLGVKRLISILLCIEGVRLQHPYMSTELFCVIVTVYTLPASSVRALAVSCCVPANMTPSMCPLQNIKSKIDTVLLNSLGHERLSSLSS